MKKLSVCIALLLSAGMVMADSGGVTCPGQGGTGNSASWTTGSVMFANGSGAGCGQTGQITQDNAQLYWDDTNFRLGISSVPVAQLDFGATAASASSLKVGAGISLPRGTSTQINQSTPPIAGVLIYNTTYNGICISTGNLIDQYMELSSGTFSAVSAVLRGCDRAAP